MNKIKIAEDVIAQAEYFIRNWDNIDSSIREKLNKDRILLTKEVMLEWINRNKVTSVEVTKVNGDNKIKLKPKRKVIEEDISLATEMSAIVTAEEVEDITPPTTIEEVKPQQGFINKIKNFLKRKDKRE